MSDELIYKAGGDGRLCYKSGGPNAGKLCYKGSTPSLYGNVFRWNAGPIYKQDANHITLTPTSVKLFESPFTLNLLTGDIYTWAWYAYSLLGSTGIWNIRGLWDGDRCKVRIVSQAFTTAWEGWLDAPKPVYPTYPKVGAYPYRPGYTDLVNSRITS